MSSDFKVLTAHFKEITELDRDSQCLLFFAYAKDDNAPLTMGVVEYRSTHEMLEMLLSKINRQFEDTGLRLTLEHIVNDN